jgi:hypothetical protein
MGSKPRSEEGLWNLGYLDLSVTLGEFKEIAEKDPEKKGCQRKNKE